MTSATRQTKGEQFEIHEIIEGSTSILNRALRIDRCKHRKMLTSLPVGTNTTRIPCQDIFNDRLQGRLKNLFLRTKGCKDIIKGKDRPGLPRPRSLDDRHCLFIGRCRYDRQGAIFLFSLVQRTKSNYDLYSGVARHSCDVLRWRCSEGNE